jgi:hypothetical protein
MHGTCPRAPSRQRFRDVLHDRAHPGFAAGCALPAVRRVGAEEFPGFANTSDPYSHSSWSTDVGRTTHGGLARCRASDRVSAALSWTGLALVAVIWLSTGVAVPRHAKLVQGFDPAIGSFSCVQTNWIRTLGWTHGRWSFSRCLRKRCGLSRTSLARPRQPETRMSSSDEHAPSIRSTG